MKKKNRSEMVYIYVLRLKEQRWYIGRSETPLKRISEHFQGKGCEWTRIYRPKKIKKIYGNCDPYDEDKFTKLYMTKYGIDNVRGGSFCTVKLSGIERHFLLKMIDGALGRCYICHSSSHFARGCPMRFKQECPKKDITQGTSWPRPSPPQIQTEDDSLECREGTCKELPHNPDKQDPQSCKRPDPTSESIV